MTMLTLSAFLVVMSSASPTNPEPVELVRGATPEQPCEAPGGGQVLLELTVGADGVPRGARTLRHTAPFTGCLRWAVAEWQFAPRSLSWRTLVAGVFRPPTFGTPTLGEAPTDIGVGSREVPYPLRVVTPPYPPRGLGDGVVVLRLEVADDGHVEDVHVVRSAPGFDDTAISAAREWQFRPAHHQDHALPAAAFLVFGFRAPVTVPVGEP